MADSKPKSGSPPAPSFYSAAAGMDGKSSSSPPPGASTGAGKEGEKVQQIEKLLEVIQMLDKQETDQSGKGMVQAIADAAKKYLDKVKGTGGDKTTAQPAAGEAGSGGMGGGDMSAGAGGPPMAGGGPPGMAA